MNIIYLRVRAILGKLLTYLRLLILFGSLIMGCTTQDFEYAGKNKDVYRVRVKNMSDVKVKYFQNVSFYYIDRKDSLRNLPDSRFIMPDDSVQLVAESKKGTYGLKMGIRFVPSSAPMQLIIEKGVGTGDNFTPNKVLKNLHGHSIFVVKYGEYY